MKRSGSYSRRSESAAHRLALICLIPNKHTFAIPRIGKYAWNFLPVLLIKYRADANALPEFGDGATKAFCCGVTMNSMSLGSDMTRSLATRRLVSD